MERGLYIAASGMLAEMVRQDQIANDLANASTPGYKSDRSSQSSFGQMLLENRVSGAQGRRLGRRGRGSGSTAPSAGRAGSASRRLRASATRATASSRSPPRAR